MFCVDLQFSMFFELLHLLALWPFANFAIFATFDYSPHVVEDHDNVVSEASRR